MVLVIDVQTRVFRVKKLCKEHYEQACNALESARSSRNGIEARKEHKKKYDAFWAEMKYKGGKNAG